MADSSAVPLQRRSQVFLEAQDPIVILDLNGVILDLNREVERLYGWSGRELVGQPWTKLCPATWRPQAEHLLRRCREGLPVRNVDGVHRSRSDVTHPVLVTLSLIRDGEGAPLGIAITAKHIARQKREQDELRLTEERHRRLLEAVFEEAVEAIVTIDERGRIESVNRAAVEMFGYTEPELLGENIAVLMPAPYREEHDDYLHHYLRTGERRIIGIGREVEARRRDGTVFPVHLAVSEVLFDHQRFFAGFIRDMEDIKRTERELRRERDFAERLVNTAQVIVVVLSLDGSVIRINRYMEELSGYALDEVRGRDWFTTFLPERDRNRVRGLFATAIGGDRVRGAVNPIVTKSGEEREVAWWDRLLEDDDGTCIGLLAIGHDVTELRRAERLAGIGEMVAGLAHESRNALQRIQSCLELLEVECGENPRASELIGRIQEAEDGLSRLYDEVRGYAAPIQLDQRACDLRRLWRAAWADLEVKHRDGDVSLEDATGDLDLTCPADPYALGQVFRNLLDNALAALDGHGRIRVLAEEAELAGGRAVVVTFNDDGPGLPEGARERVFRPFFTTRTKGTGLGMAIVRRIIEAHGGRVEAAEGPLPGAAIRLTLPVTRDP